MVESSGKFQYDSVLKYTPITFSGEFTRRMRAARGIANIPSIRTTIAIPRFLTARYFRRELLDPMDYFQAAVYNTPFEDQEIARRIARDLLFPKQKPTSIRKAKTSIETKVEVDTTSVISGVDQIINELEEAGFDDVFEAMMQDHDLEDMLEEQNTSWSFMDELLSSEDPKDKARMQLLEVLQNEFAIVQHALNSRSLVDTFLKTELTEQAGSWSPEVFRPAVNLDFQELLVRQSQMQWEVATAMGVTQHPDFKNYIDKFPENNSPLILGTTLQYLQKNNISLDEKWVNRAFKQIKTMRDYHELLQGTQSFRKPPEHALDHGAKHQIRESLDIAEAVDNQYNSEYMKTLFEKYQNSHPKPSIREVQEATYDDGKNTWQEMLKEAVNRESKGQGQSELSEMTKTIANHSNPRLSTEMKRAQTNVAKELATQNLEAITEREKFLPELDHMINNEATPHLQRTLDAGKSLGIMEDEILERFNSPLKVMETYIENGVKEKTRYDRIVRKIRGITKQQMDQMMKQAAKDANYSALGAMGAVDLRQAMQSASGMQLPDGTSAEESVAQSLDKSIGGGTNLLQQWFLHRNRLSKPVKDKLKDMMRKTLLEIGMDWANRGTGSSDEGIIPVTDTRPYREGDELDLIDIHETLSALIMSGKSIEQMTTDELMVTETSKGKTALGVLIDISGSMTGKDLAMCAVSVVMLLGKLDQKEIAVALFESNTHKIKGFDEEITLDEVADELLDLQARGGTRADAALRWASREFEGVTSSDVKILLFLSDFYLAENTATLTKLMDPMVQEDVKILAAYHSRHDKVRMNCMVETMHGNSMKVESFDKLPHIISEAIASITQ